MIAHQLVKKLLKILLAREVMGASDKEPIIELRLETQPSSTELAHSPVDGPNTGEFPTRSARTTSGRSILRR